jgi:hypothetical protein
MNCWIYKDKPLTSLPNNTQGFVYIIYDTVNNKKYIGKKNFWTTKKLPPLKGKKNKRHVKVETDWRDYYGSNNEIKSIIAKNGISQFRREILVMCENKVTMSYWETKLQFEHDVLLSDEYYNDYIGCRITSRGLK